MAADIAACGTHAEVDFAGSGDGEDAMDKGFVGSGGEDVAGFFMRDVLGLAAFGGGDDGEADDAGFLDGVGRGVGAGGVDEAPCAREGLQGFGGRAMAVEMDVGRVVSLREPFFACAVDVEIDAGEARIGEGGKEGIDALQMGERAEEDGGGFIGNLPFDGEAGGVGSVFEQINGGGGGEFSEVIRAPRGLDGEVFRFGKDGFFRGGLDAGK